MFKFGLYPVTIEPCEEGGYFAKCPAFQGCYAEGETYAEVINNIEGVIKAHIEDMKKNNEFVPSFTVKKPCFASLNIPIPIRV
ncbi:type II toxin-antitoxin system HicB family antitoxin [Patescibacteria group bacterium]|nr:type II toxin-antitoxin system HicB family antitoxin [Patescibacteria group bacterium]MBU4512784.1 type II toxin-antitoxin system HicB family antitoxin [Patescibacteria group bacterium]MCG2692527.1 type II toxin-antitoxin system HicB family antitoxin [Candidatus Parcubacteria bacterium]